MKTIQNYNKPGKYEVKIPFTKSGEKKEWVVFVDGRVAGEYELVVTAEHFVANTEGRITVRGVAGPSSNVKLFGLIKIAKEAQKTNDFLELRVLTLDPTSRGVAEPTLEIEANDVKASHAASVSGVDPEQLLYLMSRGLGRAEARGLIVEGFLVGE